MGLTVGLPQCDSPILFRRRKKRDEILLQTLCFFFGEK